VQKSLTRLQISPSATWVQARLGRPTKRISKANVLLHTERGVHTRNGAQEHARRSQAHRSNRVEGHRANGGFGQETQERIRANQTLVRGLPSLTSKSPEAVIASGSSLPGADPISLI